MYTDVLYTDWTDRVDFRVLPGPFGGLLKLLHAGFSSVTFPPRVLALSPSIDTEGTEAY